MFKSNTIATSLNANEALLNLIEQLTLNQLEQVIDTGYSIYQHERSIWSKMFAYYKEMDLAEVNHVE